MTSQRTKLDPKKLHGWRRAFFRFSSWLVECYFRAFHGLKVYGHENIPTHLKSYIVACNHTSNIDPFVVGGALHCGRKPVAFMAKQELFTNPLISWYLDAVGTFSVNREKLELSTVKSALAVLKESDWALGLFPEGTRQKQNTGTGEISSAKRGVAFFAQAAQVSILPMAIARLGPLGQITHVRIGSLIPPPADKSDAAMDATTRAVETAMTDMLAELRQNYDKQTATG